MIFPGTLSLRMAHHKVAAEGNTLHHVAQTHECKLSGPGPRRLNAGVENVLGWWHAIAA